MSADPDAVEIRVVGSLLEKQRTTPEAYPLSVNALRLACNQSTNRDPVVDYDERTVVAALERLHRRGWTRMASGAGSRARKYRQLVDRALDLDPEELALLCLLMLRGPQTPGELKQRSERLHPFADPAAVEAVLDRLLGRELVVRLDRRAGQKEQRYGQLLDGGGDAAGGSVPRTGVAASPPPEDRLARLERELAELRAEVRALREQLGG
ncbi:MAG: YceH family protein [Thermoleophilaceae bacterium]